MRRFGLSNFRFNCSRLVPVREASFHSSIFEFAFAAEQQAANTDILPMITHHRVNFRLIKWEACPVA